MAPLIFIIVLSVLDVMRINIIIIGNWAYNGTRRSVKIYFILREQPQGGVQDGILRLGSVA